MKHFANDIQRSLPASTKLPHPTGIVISGGCKIGRNVHIYQNVTLGGRHGNNSPVIEDNVKIYAGAQVLGEITIGEGSVVGANATVIDDVPPNSTVVGPSTKLV